MENRNNSSNHNNNDEDGMNRSSDDEEIDECILCQSDNFELTVPLQCWLILILLCLGIVQYWYLLRFTLVIILANQMIHYITESSVIFGRTRPWHSNSPSDFSATLNRDAQVEGRTAHPRDEVLTFSPTVMISDDTPFGIEDTQPHDMPILLNLINIRHTDIVIYNENGDINEDATLNNNNDANIIAPIDHNGINVRVMTNLDNLSQAVVDNPGVNINALNGIESQDDMNSSDSSDEDSIVSFGTSFDEDSEDNSSGDDNESTGQTLPTTSNFFQSLQNNIRSNQTNLVDRRQTITVLPSNEVTEIEENTITLVENGRQIARSLIRPTSKLILILKLLNSANPNNEPSEQTVG